MSRLFLISSVDAQSPLVGLRNTAFTTIENQLLYPWLKRSTSCSAAADPTGDLQPVRGGSPGGCQFIRRNRSAGVQLGSRTGGVDLLQARVSLRCYTIAPEPEWIMASIETSAVKFPSVVKPTPLPTSSNTVSRLSYSPPSRSLTSEPAAN